LQLPCQILKKITQGAARIAIGIQITVDGLVIRGFVNQANAI